MNTINLDQIITDFLIENYLTEKEVVIGSLISQGLTNKEVGDCLMLTEKSIEVISARIARKLGVRSRGQIIYLCQQHLKNTSPLPRGKAV